MAALFQPVRTPVFANAAIAPGAVIYFFEAGTSTPKTVYSDADLTTSLGTSVTADANGSLPAIYLDTALGLYKYRIETDESVLIDEEDNYGGVGVSKPNARFASSIDEIEALTPVANYQVSLSGNDPGVFVFSAADLSAKVASDTEQRFYIAPSSDPTGTTGAWVRTRDTDVLNTKDYATLGANLAGAISILSHTPGTIATASTTVDVQPFKYYQVLVDITTTASGFVKVLFGGADVIYGDRPDGLYFSSDAVLGDGTENNRTVSDNLYYFALGTSGTGYTELSLETDTSWGGSINTVEVKEVTPKDFGLEITAADGLAKNNPMGIKGGAYNRGDIALGDKFTLGAFEYDALSPTPAFNVAVGARALAATFKGDQNTALGSFALQTCEGSNNVAVGYSALKLNNKGQENTAVGYKCGQDVTTGFRNVFAGFWSGSGVVTGANNVEIGWKPNTQPGDRSNTTVVGYQAGLLQGAGSDANVILGSSSNRTGTARVLTGVVSAGSESHTYDPYGVSVGFQAKSGVEAGGADGSVAVGRGASAAAPAVPSVAIGDLAQANGDRAISAGQSSKANGEQTAAYGGLAEANGQYTTSLGAQAGRNNTGTGNTYVGRLAGNAATNAFTNTTCLGQTSAVTASDQVQLGNSTTTTYAYGPVQDRSDARDKVDIKALTDAQIAFFMDVEWRQFRMDYREDYDWGEKDGSKARERFHIGAIAQQVEEAMKRHGIDFAGLQHHSVKGGMDVYSIGYQEFIGLQGEIIQRQQRQLSAIEARLAKAGL